MTVNLNDLEDVRKEAVRAENKITNAKTGGSTGRGSNSRGPKSNKATTGHITAIQGQPSTQRDRSKDKCHYCKQLGHHKWECPALKTKKRAEAVTSSLPSPLIDSSFFPAELNQYHADSEEAH